jgi:hypothetical protein
VVSVTSRQRFSPGERIPGTHCTGGWVGLRAGLDTEARGKILCSCRGSKPDRPVVQSVVRYCTAWATPAPMANNCHYTRITASWNADNRLWFSSSNDISAKLSLHYEGIVVRDGIGYCYRVVSYKASHVLQPFSDPLCSYRFRFIEPSALVAADTPSSEAGRHWTRKAAEFFLSITLSYLKESLTFRKILRHGADGCASTPN